MRLTGPRARPQRAAGSGRRRLRGAGARRRRPALRPSPDPTDLLHALYGTVFRAEGHRPDLDRLLRAVREIGAVVVVDDLEFGGAALEEFLDATPSAPCCSPPPPTCPRRRRTPTSKRCSSPASAAPAPWSCWSTWCGAR
ncbi:hypothetical protein NKH77_36030 [Streptomyces sp. M19]